MMRDLCGSSSFQAPDAEHFDGHAKCDQKRAGGCRSNLKRDFFVKLKLFTFWLTANAPAL